MDIQYNDGDLFGLDLKKITSLRTNNASNIKEFFVKLVCDPYMEVSNADYAKYVGEMFRGDMGMQLMRPKGLGDQLYNKLLLNNLYDQGEVLGPSVPTSQYNSVDMTLI